MAFDVRRVIADNGLSITALATSVLSLTLSTCISAQSLATSRQSVDLFRESNEILLGKVLPQVQITPEVMAIGVESVEQLTVDSPQQSITVWNVGRVAISELTVDIIPIEGLVYRIDNILESFRRISPTTERLVLREQLIPDGRASLRMRPCLLAYIDRSDLAYSNPDVKYRFIANVVVLATRSGQTAPLPRSGNDSTLITVDYIPRLLSDAAAQTYLKNEKCETQVFR